MLSPRRVLFLVLLFSLALPSLAQAGVQPSYDLSTPDGGPFPSDRWTATDWSQPTGVRVNLPKPDCTARPSDCADIDVLWRVAEAFATSGGPSAAADAFESRLLMTKPSAL